MRVGNKIQKRCFMKKPLLSLFTICIILLFCGCYKIDSTSSQDYANFYKKSDEIALQCDFLPLPENVKDFEDVLLYYSDYDLLDSYHTIYLNCNFTDENFQTEKQRALNYGENYDFTVYNSDSFALDSIYINTLDCEQKELHHIYISYVLFDDKNNKIIYVMIFEEGDKNRSGGVFNKSSAIPDEYLPKELLEYKNK